MNVSCFHRQIVVRNDSIERWDRIAYIPFQICSVAAMMAGLVAGHVDDPFFFNIRFGRQFALPVAQVYSFDFRLCYFGRAGIDRVDWNAGWNE